MDITVSSVPATAVRPSLFDVKVGDNVTTLDCSVSFKRPIQINRGTVEKITPKQFVVRNEHGNVQRFWRQDGRCVGWDYTYSNRWIGTADGRVFRDDKALPFC